jgi:MFS family permease
MGVMLSAMTLVTMSAGLFVPIFVIALAMRLPALRALALSGTFTLGAVVGGIAASWLGSLLLGRVHDRNIDDLYGVLFLAAGAAAGGVLAVWLLARLSNTSPWKRD